MSRLIARLILAMLILPVTGALFVFLFVGLIVPAGVPGPGRIIVFWAAIYAFVAAYWVLLWRSAVRWTRWRVAGTVLAGVAALACAVVVGVVVLAAVPDPGAAVFIAGGVVPVIWVLATVLIWRETPRERMERLAAAGREAVSCPICGYNLTGLTEARCPECGASFTLDQLLHTQPRKDEEAFARG